VRLSPYVTKNGMIRLKMDSYIQAVDTCC